MRAPTEARTAVGPVARRSTPGLRALCADIVACRRCPRVVEYRARVAQDKRRAYRHWEYWGRPLPGFGDPAARLLVIGLAPAAHGGNRTGRLFTGDRSGDWLYATLHRFGFANQPDSTHRDDGLRLIDAYVTAAARCAPPDNKPTREELSNCQPYLEGELQLLRGVRVVIALGRIAFDAYVGARRALELPVPQPRPQFAHARVDELSDTFLIGSYHPSQRNTQTGMLTHTMFDRVFATARRLLPPLPSGEAVDKREPHPSRRSQEKGPPQGERKSSLENTHRTARPEEPSSSGGVSKGARRRKSTVFERRGNDL